MKHKFDTSFDSTHNMYELRTAPHRTHKKRRRKNTYREHICCWVNNIDYRDKWRIYTVATECILCCSPLHNFLRSPIAADKIALSGTSQTCYTLYMFSCVYRGVVVVVGYVNCVANVVLFEHIIIVRCVGSRSVLRRKSRCRLAICRLVVFSEHTHLKCMEVESMFFEIDVLLYIPWDNEHTNILSFG